MRSVVLVIHNVRSCHNVGSLLRTAEGLGVEKIFLTGYTPYPPKPNDIRLPHLAARTGKQINKTALGAETMLAWEQQEDIQAVIARLRSEQFRITALEQTPESIVLPEYEAPERVALILGREVEGIETEVLSLADDCIAIPMFGRKESFNVTQAAAMALYHCRFSKN